MSYDKVTAFYIRTATEDMKSINLQKEQLTTYCKVNEIQNYEFYIDAGHSGNDLERPAMQKLIQAAKDGKLSTLVVCELSRLSRSARGALHLINDILIPNEVDVISLMDSLDTSTPVGKFVVNNYLELAIERGKRVCQEIKR